MATSATFMLVQAGHRVEIATTIGRLINAFDDLEADPDLEPTGDDEPSRGWTDMMARYGLKGADMGDGREHDTVDDEDGFDREDDGDDKEPSLGGTGRYCYFHCRLECDLEADNGGYGSVDDEPWLGWTTQIDHAGGDNWTGTAQWGEHDGEADIDEQPQGGDERGADPAELGIADADALAVCYPAGWWQGTAT